MPTGQSLTSRAHLSPSGPAEGRLTAANRDDASARAGRHRLARGGALAGARSGKPSRVTHLRREPGSRTPGPYTPQSEQSTSGSRDAPQLAQDELVPRSAIARQGPRRRKHSRVAGTRRGVHRQPESHGSLRGPLLDERGTGGARLRLDTWAAAGRSPGAVLPSTQMRKRECATMPVGLSQLVQGEHGGSRSTRAPYIANPLPADKREIKLRQLLTHASG